MGGQSREGTQYLNRKSIDSLLIQAAGGKVKPLKAPKKDKKDLDEDELAFKQKQAAGTTHRSRHTAGQRLTSSRQKGAKGNGRQSRWPRPSQYRTTRNKEEWKEIRWVFSTPSNIYERVQWPQEMTAT